MTWRRLQVVATLCVLVTAAVLCSNAQAASVLVMGQHGHVHRTQNHFLSAAQSISPAQLRTAAPRGTSRSAGSRAHRVAASGALALTPAAATKKKKTKQKPVVTVPTVLAKLAASQQITAAEQTTYLQEWNSALHEEKHLSQTRSAQLAAVTVMLHTMAADGEMTASRLPVLFLTLEKNAQWWKTGPMLSYGQRVQFKGSELEWEYYTNEGIQLQVLGTFGEANGYYEAGKSTYPQLLEVMDEMIPLAVQRGGGLAWEYYFDWEGGSPPWVSAMAQATGLEALANAYTASQDSTYLTAGESALGILQTPPPTGVAVPTSLGTRFLQYSFAPKEDIINAFLQTLIGLDDFATVSGDGTAADLFAAGNAQAMAELPSFNTGAWSLYEPGEQDDLSYHQLVTGFLTNLCKMTKTPIYCSTGQDFTTDLSTPPTITQVTTQGRAKTAFKIDFTLDKPAHIGVVLTNAAGRQYLYTSADCEPGTDYWIAPKLPKGVYTLKLSGTDLADNYATTTGTITVS